MPAQPIKFLGELCQSVHVRNVNEAVGVTCRFDIGGSTFPDLCLEQVAPSESSFLKDGSRFVKPRSPGIPCFDAYLCFPQELRGVRSEIEAKFQLRTSPEESGSRLGDVITIKLISASMQMS